MNSSNHKTNLYMLLSAIVGWVPFKNCLNLHLLCSKCSFVLKMHLLQNCSRNRKTFFVKNVDISSGGTKGNSNYVPKCIKFNTVNMVKRTVLKNGVIIINIFFFNLFILNILSMEIFFHVLFPSKYFFYVSFYMQIFCTWITLRKLNLGFLSLFIILTSNYTSLLLLLL